VWKRVSLPAPGQNTSICFGVMSNLYSYMKSVTQRRPKQSNRRNYFAKTWNLKV